MKLLHNVDSYIITCLDSVVVTERTDYSLTCYFDKQHRDFLVITLYRTADVGVHYHSVEHPACLKFRQNGNEIL